MNLARSDREIDSIIGDDTRKPLRDAAELERGPVVLVDGLGGAVTVSVITDPSRLRPWPSSLSP